MLMLCLPKFTSDDVVSSNQPLTHDNIPGHAGSGSLVCNGYLRRFYFTTVHLNYLIIDFIEDSQGTLLSKLWTTSAHEQRRRWNFFKDLSRVMLTLARIPFELIGSLTIDDAGYIQLKNRPLTFRLHQMENEGIPLAIKRDFTYSCTKHYFSDLLSCHESRIRHQNNSIIHLEDGETKLSCLAAIRALISHVINHNLENGPFVLTLTDIHPNNVFVDKDWNITCLIDLEWACVRPLEMILPPIWLTGKRVDEMPRGDILDAYNHLLKEFFICFEEEERKAFNQKVSLLAMKSIRDCWHNGKIWYFHALDNPKVLVNLFFQHIRQHFSNSCGKDMDFCSKA